MEKERAGSVFPPVVRRQRSYPHDDNSSDTTTTRGVISCLDAFVRRDRKHDEQGNRRPARSRDGRSSKGSRKPNFPEDRPRGPLGYRPRYETIRRRRSRRSHSDVYGAFSETGCCASPRIRIDKLLRYVV